MELLNLSKVFGTEGREVVCVDGKYLRSSRHVDALTRLVDGMGQLSAIAQGLNQPVTSVSTLVVHADQRLYLALDGDAVIGLLKVGIKRLFVTRLDGSTTEIDTTCVLDFYVHESRQRQGTGHLLMSTMLKQEGVRPERVGYDRPSPKYLNFLAKHYGLVEYVPQANNFVVFEAAFNVDSSHNRSARTPTKGASLEEITRAITPAGRQFYRGGADPVAAQVERKMRYASPRVGSMTARSERSQFESSPMLSRPTTAPAVGWGVDPVLNHVATADRSKRYGYAQQPQQERIEHLHPSPVPERRRVPQPTMKPQPTYQQAQEQQRASKPPKPVEKREERVVERRVERIPERTEQRAPKPTGYAELHSRRLTPAELFAGRMTGSVNTPPRRELRPGMGNTRFR